MCVWVCSVLELTGCRIGVFNLNICQLTIDKETTVGSE